MIVNLTELRALAEELARLDARLEPVSLQQRKDFFGPLNIDVTEDLLEKAFLYHTEIAHSVPPVSFDQPWQVCRAMREHVTKKSPDWGVPYWIDLGALEAAFERVVTPALVVELIDKANAYDKWSTKDGAK